MTSSLASTKRLSSKAPAPLPPGDSQTNVYSHHNEFKEGNQIASYNALVYQFDSNKKWNLVSKNYVSIVLLDCGGDDLTKRYQINIAESRNKLFASNLSSSCNLKIKDSFVRWESGPDIFGARFTKQDLAQKFYCQIRELLNEIGPYAKVTKPKMNTSASTNSMDLVGVLPQVRENESNVGLSKNIRLNVEIKPTEITQFQASGQLTIKEFLQTVCTTAGLDALSFVFVYPDTVEAISQETKIQDLKGCVLKVVKIKDLKKISNAAAKGKPKKKNSGGIGTFFSKNKNESVKSPELEELELLYEDPIWKTFLDLANLHKAELSNVHVKGAVESFVEERGGYTFLRHVNDQKMTPQLADDLNTLAGQLHAIISPASPDPSTETESLEGNEFMSTLDRKAKRKAKAPKPPDIPIPYDRQSSVDVLKVNGAVIESPSGKRRAPSVPVKAVSSPLASSKPSVDTQISESPHESASSGGMSPPTTPIAADVFNNDQQISSRGLSNSQSLPELPKTAKNEDKPPPVFIPPPPPHEPPPPPDERSSPVGPLSPSVTNKAIISKSESKDADSSNEIILTADIQKDSEQHEKLCGENQIDVESSDEIDDSITMQGVDVTDAVENQDFNVAFYDVVSSLDEVLNDENMDESEISEISKNHDLTTTEDYVTDNFALNEGCFKEELDMHEKNSRDSQSHELPSVVENKPSTDLTNKKPAILKKPTEMTKGEHTMSVKKENVKGDQELDGGKDTLQLKTTETHTPKKQNVVEENQVIPVDSHISLSSGKVAVDSEVRVETSPTLPQQQTFDLQIQSADLMKEIVKLQFDMQQPTDGAQQQVNQQKLIQLLLQQQQMLLAAAQSGQIQTLASEGGWSQPTLLGEQHSHTSQATIQNAQPSQGTSVSEQNAIIIPTSGHSETDKVERKVELLKELEGTPSQSETCVKRLEADINDTTYGTNRSVVPQEEEQVIDPTDRPEGEEAPTFTEIEEASTLMEREEAPTLTERDEVPTLTEGEEAPTLTNDQLTETVLQQTKSSSPMSSQKNDTSAVQQQTSTENVSYTRTKSKDEAVKDIKPSESSLLIPSKKPPTGLYAKLKAKTMSSNIVASAQSKETTKTSKHCVSQNANNKTADLTKDDSKINTSPPILRTKDDVNLMPQSKESKVEKFPEVVGMKNKENVESNSKVKQQGSTQTSSIVLHSSDDSNNQMENCANKTQNSSGFIKEKQIANISKLKAQFTVNEQLKEESHKNDKDISSLDQNNSWKPPKKQSNLSHRSPCNDLKQVITYPYEQIQSEKKSETQNKNKVSGFPEKPAKLESESLTYDPDKAITFPGEQVKCDDKASTYNSTKAALSPQGQEKSPKPFDSVIDSVTRQSENTSGQEICPLSLETTKESTSKNQSQELFKRSKVTNNPENRKSDSKPEYNPNSVIQFPDQEKNEDDVKEETAMNYKAILAANRSQSQSRPRNSSFVMKQEKEEEMKQKRAQQYSQYITGKAEKLSQNQKSSDPQAVSTAVSPREKLIKDIEEHGIPILSEDSKVKNTGISSSRSTGNSKYPENVRTKNEPPKKEYLFTITNVKRELPPVVSDKKPPGVRPKPVKQKSPDNESGMFNRSQSVTQVNNPRKPPPQVMKKPLHRNLSLEGQEKNLKPSDLFGKPNSMQPQFVMSNSQNVNTR